MCDTSPSAKGRDMSDAAHQAHIQSVLRLIDQRIQTGRRTVVAIAGPPASGKSTLAEAVVQQLNQQAIEAPAYQAALLPMDGYHLDNVTLDQRGLRARKGSVDTFAAAEFCAAVRAVAELGSAHDLPGFDRDSDSVVAGQIRVDPSTQIIVVEGNYLLLDRSPWRDLQAFYAATVFVCAPRTVLRERLMARWNHQNLLEQEAAAKVAINDLPNADVVLRERLAADLLIEHKTSDILQSEP